MQDEVKFPSRLQPVLDDVKAIWRKIHDHNSAREGVPGFGHLMLYDFEEELKIQYGLPYSSIPAFQFNPKEKSVSLSPDLWLPFL